MALFAKKVKKELDRVPASPTLEETTHMTSGELVEAERVLRQGTVKVRDLIAPSSFRILPNHLELNGTWLRTLFVMNYPRYISVGWFTPVINMNATLDIGMFFYQVKPEIILKQLRNKVGALEAQIVADQEKGAPRDPIRETALKNLLGLLV